MAMLPVFPGPARSGARFWMNRAGYGLLLSAAIVALEFAYYFPLITVRGELGLESFASMLMTWCAECVLYALAVGFIETRVYPRDLRAWELALTIVTCAFVVAVIWNVFADLVLRERLGLRLFVDHVGQPVEWLGGALYHGWMIFFFGGLAAAVQASLQRRARMLGELRAAELDRAIAQQRLAELTLGSLQARIDPDTLFGSLNRLERLYESDPPAADRLLDELIAYLRGVLAGVRASATTSPDARADGAPGRPSGYAPEQAS